jgi:hypothetical protein
MTFTLDTFHPDRIACDVCNQHFGPITLDDGDDPVSLDSLTEDQVAHRWPALAEDVRLHVLVCAQRGEPSQEEWERWAAPR